MKKIGILGGTFNPPHNAHIMMAGAAVKAGGMDEIILMPNGDPPHKRISVKAEDRLAMTRLAAEQLKAEGIPEAAVSVTDIEICREGFSFLADTLEELKRQHPDDELYFITGGDAVSSMASWYGSDRIFAAVKILAFRRAGGLGLSIEPAVSYLRRRGADVSVVDYELPDISSTRIRAAAAEGADISEWVPESVAEYIREKRIYTEN